MAVDTKELILDAAEALIAKHGIDAVSLRAITSAAKVNLASVHYHFGSKEALVRYVFERRIGPVNLRRMELLDEAGDDAEIECILRAFIEPSIRLYAQHPNGPMFMRVCGRIFYEPSPHLQQALDDFFTEIVARFSRAFQRALPHLDPAETAWRMHFMAGSMIHTLIAQDRLERFTNGACTMDDPEAVIDRIVAFCAAGMRVPQLQEVATLQR